MSSEITFFKPVEELTHYVNYSIDFKPRDEIDVSSTRLERTSIVIRNGDLLRDWFDNNWVKKLCK